MEEFVGEIWHRFVTKQANSEFIDASITLDELAPQLAPFFRAMGGDPGKIIEHSSSRHFAIKRTLIQRIAGTHQKFHVSWQDDHHIYLPSKIALFSDKELNKSLYFWLTALAAEQTTIQHWLTDNQTACKTLLTKRPGLKSIYEKLVKSTLQLRPNIHDLDVTHKVQELAIQQALKHPGSIHQTTRAPSNHMPVALWLYPAPVQSSSVKSSEQIDPIQTPPEDQKSPTATSPGRKQAQRIDDNKETDGLLVFQLASLFSWAEQVELDRCQDENQDDDATTATEDLDIITLSRQRRAGAAKIKFDLDLPSAHNDELPLGDGILLPEWNYKKQCIIKNFCLLQPMLADDAQPIQLPVHLNDHAQKLKKQFAYLKPNRQWLFRQPFGEEIDINAWLEHSAQPVRNQDKQSFFKTQSANTRELSCLLLADLSMSTDASLTTGLRVIDIIRDTLLLFAEALNSSGDQFSIYGFSSVKNKQVRFNLLKNFAESYTDHTRGRIAAIKPGFYTRMGAAIRQSTKILQAQKTQQRLLLIISDGKPNDIDHYDGRYGIEDTRQSIFEAKNAGLQPFCVTIDQKGSHYLPYLFGDHGYTVVSDISRLPTLLPTLYLNLTQNGH